MSEDKLEFVIDNEHPDLGGNMTGGTIGDPATFFPQLWDFLIVKLSIKSVLDFGCGCGYSTNFFAERGVDVLGFDGLHKNIDFARKHHKGQYVVYDLCNPTDCPELNRTFDLCWCCEVVEHIEEKYVNNIVQIFKKCKWIAMTYAPPGQGGHHHVNCKPEEYWVQGLKISGIYKNDFYTYLSRPLAQGHWGNKGIIFENK